MDGEATEKLDKLALAVVALSEAILCLPEAEEESLGHATKACNILAGFSCIPKRSAFKEAMAGVSLPAANIPDIDLWVWNKALETLKPIVKEILASASVQRAIDAHMEPTNG